MKPALRLTVIAITAVMIVVALAKPVIVQADTPLCVPTGSPTSRNGLTSSPSMPQTTVSIPIWSPR